MVKRVVPRASVANMLLIHCVVSSNHIVLRSIAPPTEISNIRDKLFNKGSGEHSGSEKTAATTNRIPGMHVGYKDEGLVLYYGL